MRYGKTHALDAVTLDMPAGCMVGLIGPDGVGKSSLLALIAGARRIQQGRVEVLGGDMADAGHRRTVCPRIAYMPQGLGKNLYPTLSVFENADFFGRLFGHGRAERRRRIADLLESTGLAPFADRPAGKLSGGMKQKLCLCCALIHDPDLLILDEPTTGVDPLSRRQFWELIDRIRADRPGMSVVVATAYMEEAARFDWLVAMDAGRVLATGTPAELLARTGTGDPGGGLRRPAAGGEARGHQEVVIPPRAAGGGEVAIEARDLTQRFGSFVAVDHVNFRIERGEIFGFLGSNGCGKTTTMKMLTGLLPRHGRTGLAVRPRGGCQGSRDPSAGGLHVAGLLALFRADGPAEPGPARPAVSCPEDEIPGRVEQAAGRFGLAEVIDALPDSLPLGQRQRLSLAVALIHQPELLILDEPTSGVDPVARDSFWQHADRPLPPRQGHHLHLHPLHERGPALRPHLADARRPGAGRATRRPGWSKNAARPRWKRPSSATWKRRHPRGGRQGDARRPRQAVTGRGGRGRGSRFRRAQSRRPGSACDAC